VVPPPLREGEYGVEGEVIPDLDGGAGECGRGEVMVAILERLPLVCVIYYR